MDEIKATLIFQNPTPKLAKRTTHDDERSWTKQNFPEEFGHVVIDRVVNGVTMEYKRPFDIKSIKYKSVRKEAHAVLDAFLDTIGVEKDYS